MQALQNFSPSPDSQSCYTCIMTANYRGHLHTGTHLISDYKSVIQKHQPSFGFINSPVILHSGGTKWCSLRRNQVMRIWWSLGLILSQNMLPRTALALSSITWGCTRKGLGQKGASQVRSAHHKRNLKGFSRHPADFVHIPHHLE